MGIIEHDVLLRIIHSLKATASSDDDATNDVQTLAQVIRIR